MPRFRLVLDIIIEAKNISTVDDDAIGEAVMAAPGVIEVTAHAVEEEGV